MSTSALALTGVLLNTSAVFDIARRAFQRTLIVANEREPLPPDDPLVAVVFAVLALETFITELGELADMARFADTPSVALLATLLAELERSHVQIKVKYQLAATVFGKPFDKGKQPFQDFDVLVDVRNQLIHLKPRDGFLIGGGFVPYEDVVKRLRGKKLLAEKDGNEWNGPWTLKISTRATARWACQTCIAMARSLLEVLPACGYFEAVNRLYSGAFRAL